MFVLILNHVEIVDAVGWDCSSKSFTILLACLTYCDCL